MRPILRLRATILAGALIAVLGAVSPVPAAVATGGTTGAAAGGSQPPVTADNHVLAYPGQIKVVDVLANDGDPDGDDLAVCRVQPPPKENGVVQIADDKLVVMLDPPDTDAVTFTYYACDYQTLVPATVTVTMKEVVPLRMRKPDRPGRLRVTNRNDARVRFLYGNFDEERPDGSVGIPPHSSAVIRVHRHRIDWIAVLARSVTLGPGRVRGIELPR